jgi:6-pyruvoyltetrahydropterin/6-carboxytetrahydropterin synthase
MFSIFIEAQFEARHQVMLPDGTREPLHSHLWQVTAAVSAEELNAQGFVMDFLELKRIVKAAIAPFQRQQLEQLDCFSAGNTSAEAVAQYVFDAIAPQISPPARLAYVDIVEAAGCRARYRPTP